MKINGKYVGVTKNDGSVVIGEYAAGATLAVEFHGPGIKNSNIDTIANDEITI